MAMLAEKRSRKKWTLNPRGTLWSKDEGKFGQKMLEKLGWRSGEGLGAANQGIVDPITLAGNSDNKGLGHVAGENDVWLSHKDNFDDVLASLNSEHSRNDEAAASDESAFTTLASNSKKARKRVHYEKFTRGKDLSGYSENDLSCILGTEERKKRKREAEKERDATQDPDRDSFKDTSGLQVIKGGSLDDYFRKKMKMLQAKREGKIEPDEKNDLKKIKRALEDDSEEKPDEKKIKLDADDTSKEAEKRTKKDKIDDKKGIAKAEKAETVGSKANAFENGGKERQVVKSGKKEKKRTKKCKEEDEEIEAKTSENKDKIEKSDIMDAMKERTDEFLTGDTTEAGKNEERKGAEKKKTKNKSGGKGKEDEANAHRDQHEVDGMKALAIEENAAKKEKKKKSKDKHKEDDENAMSAETSENKAKEDEKRKVKSKEGDIIKKEKKRKKLSKVEGNSPCEEKENEEEEREKASEKPSEIVSDVKSSKKPKKKKKNKEVVVPIGPQVDPEETLEAQRVSEIVGFKGACSLLAIKGYGVKQAEDGQMQKRSKKKKKVKNKSQVNNKNF